MIWSADGKSIITVAGEQGTANLIRVDVASSAVTPVYQGAHTVQAYTATPDARTIAAVTSTGTNINDLFVLDTTSASTQADHARQHALFKTIKLSSPKKSGGRVSTDEDPGGYRSARLTSRSSIIILEIHGGPHSAYGNVFTHEFHLDGPKGYVVLFPNCAAAAIRQEFGNIIQPLSRDDYKDLMAGVDDGEAWLHRQKRNVTGGSGGGCSPIGPSPRRIGRKRGGPDAIDRRLVGVLEIADFTHTRILVPQGAMEDPPTPRARRSPVATSRR